MPLLLGVLAALILRQTNPRGCWLNGAGLALSTLYLVWSIGAKLHVNAVVEAELARASVTHDRFLAIPTSFNTLLWRVLVMTPTGYAEGLFPARPDPPSRTHAVPELSRTPRPG